MDECIQNGILADFLKRNRSEALRMSIFEYDQETHIKQEREEAVFSFRPTKQQELEMFGRQQQIEVGLEILRKV